MNKSKREALEAKGWKFGNAEDFLELTEEECRMVDEGLERDRRMAELRLSAARAVRSARIGRKLTQSQAAKALGTKQPNVSKIEAAAEDVSLDMMFRSLFRLGGTADVVFSSARPPRKPPKRRRSSE